MPFPISCASLITVQRADGVILDAERVSRRLEGCLRLSGVTEIVRDSSSLEFGSGAWDRGRTDLFMLINGGTIRITCEAGVAVLHYRCSLIRLVLISTAFSLLVGLDVLSGRPTWSRDSALLAISIWLFIVVTGYATVAGSFPKFLRGCIGRRTEE